MIKIEAFAHRTQVETAALRTEGGRLQLVFDMRHGLARTNERRQPIALVELCALLVHGEIEVVEQRGNLRKIILQPDRKAALVRQTGDEPVVTQLVIHREREAGVGGVPVHQVGSPALNPLARHMSKRGP
nr:hypothetical protein [Actinomadura rubrobrunea]